MQIRPPFFPTSRSASSGIRPEPVFHGLGSSGGPRCTLLLVASLACFLASTWGGFEATAAAQYTPPGSATPNERVPDEDIFEENIKAAPWTFGGLRVLPWAGVRDAGFVRTKGNDGSKDDDFTATVGAGLRAYLPVGGKVYWAAHALPEYVWWADNEAKRRTNGRYGVGLFGYFNRLQLEASWRIDETQQFFSNEVQELTTTRQTVGRLAAELKLGSRVSLFGQGQRSETANQEDESSRFLLLDRDEELAVLGVRYRAPRGWMLGLGYEDRSTSFVSAARSLSNTGSAQRLELGLDGNRVDLALKLVALELDPDADSAFVPVDETVGHLDALWNLSERVAMLTYVRRDVSYSLDLEQSHYLGERFGARFDFRLRKATFGLFVEAGNDDYEPLLSNQVPRLDDVTTFGAQLDFEFRELFVLSVQLRETEYDSNFDAFDRDVTNLGFNVQLGALVRRLSLGNSGGQW